LYAAFQNHSFGSDFEVTKLDPPVLWLLDVSTGDGSSPVKQLTLTADGALHIDCGAAGSIRIDPYYLDELFEAYEGSNRGGWWIEDEDDGN
jgi:hypothetical protein